MEKLAVFFAVVSMVFSIIALTLVSVDKETACSVVEFSDC